MTWKVTECNVKMGKMIEFHFEVRGNIGHLIWLLM